MPSRVAISQMRRQIVHVRYITNVYLVLLLWRCMPTFRVNLIDVPLVIGRNRDIEFPSWTAITLKGSIMLRVTNRRVSRWWGTAGWTDCGFRSCVQPYIFFRNFYIFKILRGFWKISSFYHLSYLFDSNDRF